MNNEREELAATIRGVVNIAGNPDATAQLAMSLAEAILSAGYTKASL